jgi:hypothetical protein
VLLVLLDRVGRRLNSLCCSRNCTYTTPLLSYGVCVKEDCPATPFVLSIARIGIEGGILLITPAVRCPPPPPAVLPVLAVICSPSHWSVLPLVDPSRVGRVNSNGQGQARPMIDDLAVPQDNERETSNTIIYPCQVLVAIRIHHSLTLPLTCLEWGILCPRLSGGQSGSLHILNLNWYHNS